SAIRSLETLKRMDTFGMKSRVRDPYARFCERTEPLAPPTQSRGFFLLKLLDKIIDHPLPASASQGKGVPIGNLTSQHFANLYLSEADQFIKSELSVKGYVRYMDDLLCFAKSKAQLQELHFELQQFLTERLALTLKPKATRLAPVSEGIDYLGVRIFRGTIRLQKQRWRRFEQKLREREHQWRQGALSEEHFFQSVNGLQESLKWANTFHLRQKFFNKTLEERFDLL
ncbi:RNA-directed DNA polymerase, partial [Deltaproteobacteria bacterium TL4]